MYVENVSQYDFNVLDDLSQNCKCLHEMCVYFRSGNENSMIINYNDTHDLQ